MIRRLIFPAAFLAITVAASAQETLAVNPVYRRAQALVNDGNPAAGRALIDSIIAATPAGTNEYAEAIYWRAVLASTAVEAEMDYRRVVVDFPTSPRVDDALIRLAQLEIARANHDGALRHLNRIVTEHPDSPARARAGYWMARALFDKNDVQGGCAATADALSRTNEGDVELRNQISYLNQRCAGIAVVSGQPPATPATSPPAASVASDSSAVATVPSRDTVARPAPPPPAPVPAPVPPPAPARVSPSPVKPAPVTTSGGEKRAWSVQVAAYNVKSQADAMVARLKRNGYEARVDGTSAPYRVRIGRYDTQGQASAVQRSLKAKQIEGFVVQAER
jgi:cell division septation protein DedD